MSKAGGTRSCRGKVVHRSFCPYLNMNTGKRQDGWEDNIKVNFKTTGCKGVNILMWPRLWPSSEPYHTRRTVKQIITSRVAPRSKGQDEGGPVRVMKTFRRIEVQLHSFLTSPRDGEWSASHSGRVTRSTYNAICSLV